MVITIPRMGNICIAAKAFFEALQIPYIIPKKINKRTLQTGVSLSPEEICLPFKILMGNYIECIKEGADTILITGSCGPCRFGEYCELQMKLLNKFGYKANTIVIDSPAEIGADAFWNRIFKISSASKISRIKKLKALWQAFHILVLADNIDARAHYLAGYEINKGECKRLLTECKLNAEKCNDPVLLQNILTQYQKRFDNIRIDKERNAIKVTLIGEIYSMIEPFANLYIEEKLMDYGVSTTRLITPSWWVKDMVLKPIKLNSLDVKKNAKPYLPINVGGHSREAIAQAVLSEKNEVDGAIQIFPLGCMPEIVTKAILPTIQKEKDFPIMILIIDEMTGEAGYITRIEAFLDMLEARKKKGVMRA